MYINTVGFYTGVLSVAGNPTPYAVTPHLRLPFTDSMNVLQRTYNAVLSYVIETLHYLTMKIFVEDVLRTYLAKDMPPVFELGKNVSFILHNGDVSVSYPRPYLPNVAEVACIHCKPSKALPQVSTI
jgi:UDP-glucoronosyl and UDP-glucosyl transferase